MQNTTSRPPVHLALYQALVGIAFLGLVAVVSLPAARGVGPIGWMPMWLLGMPMVALAALGLAGRGQRGPAGRPAASGPAGRRRARPVPKRHRNAPRPAAVRRHPRAPAAA